MTTQYRTIHIDFDINKKIEAERRSFDESENEVLRRLLGIRPTAPAVATQVKEDEGRAWSNGDITLPHGTHLKMSYNGRAYAGRIVDGEWAFQEGRFNSPSGAASHLAVTRNGKRTSLDGYKYWWVRRPTEVAWLPLESLKPTPDKASEQRPQV